MMRSGLILLLLASVNCFGQEAEPVLSVAPEVVDKIQNTRESIVQDEKSQREALSHLFSINQQVKEMARKQAQLNEKLMSQEANVRTLAQGVAGMDQKAEMQKETLNKRLRQLYQERGSTDFQWLFMAGSPMEIERNHRFLRLMVDSDHRKFKAYLRNLRELKRKRGELKDMVSKLAGLQKEIQNQEGALTSQLREKLKVLTQLREAKDMKLSELKDLRTEVGEAATTLSYAFFERKGALKPPIDRAIVRDFGTYVDPNFRFRLTHKGLFYTSTQPAEVRAVYHGRVVFANQLPGYGRAVIVDHGDNYYSVYGFAKQVKVREGMEVREGDPIAVSGGRSPLFGPGLYFEIRHFTDAIDPQPWIKESIIKTANISRDDI